MATVYCDNCGTSLLEETSKFCRACGKPTPQSEAATKRFDESPVIKHPTNPVGGSYTTPAYMAPFEMPPADQTNDLRLQRQKRSLIMVVSMMALMIVALGGLLVFFTLRTGPGTVPGVPPPPPPPALKGPPPPPPPPGGAPAGIDASLIYPGSSELMHMQGGDGTKLVKLHSNDSVSTVVEWYKARLGAAKITQIFRQTFLETEDLTIMILGGDGGAEILITRGDDKK